MKKENRKKSKAISLRYTEERWDELTQMKNLYCESTGFEITTSSWMKSMIQDGFRSFVRVIENIENNLTIK